MMSRAWIVLAVGVLLPALGPTGLDAQSKSTWDGVFTKDQAGRGLDLYGMLCASCHGPDLGGIDASPALVGGRFASNWNGVIIADMVDRIRISMPQNAPGSLNRQQVTDVLAYILSANGFPAGERELPRQAGFQRDIAYSSYRSGELEAASARRDAHHAGSVALVVGRPSPEAPAHAAPGQPERRGTSLRGAVDAR